MKARFTAQVFALLVLLPVVADGVQQQRRQPAEQAFKVEITAAPGTVNLVEGEVYEHLPFGARRRLLANRLLVRGQRISTGGDGKVEILLHPGCYLRLAANSELILTDLSLGNLKLRLERGALLFEILKNNTEVFWSQEFYNQVYDLITLITPQSQFALARHGVYRFDVTPAPAAVVAVQVRQGEVVADGFKVSEGARLTLAGGVPRFDKLADSLRSGVGEDGFDSWSRARALELADANKELKKEPWYLASRGGNSSVVIPRPAGSESSALEAYSVSAKGGRAIFVEEGVRYQRGEEPWQALPRGFQLESGDRIHTQPYSRADIVVLPQAYLRLAGGSEVLLSSLTLNEVVVQIEKGEAIVEVWERNENFLPKIEIIYQQSAYRVKKQGNYRFDARQPGKFEARVREGELEVRGQRLKRGKRTTDDGRAHRISDFNPKALDSFDLWNRERNEISVVANQSYYRRRLPGLKANRISVIGVWYRLTGRGYYTMLPASPLGYRSPYGVEYTTTMSNRRRR